MKQIALNEVCFLEDLPVLLGIGSGYAFALSNPNKTGTNKAWYEAQRFPLPFYVSPSGIRVWFLKDVKQWALGIRSKSTGLRKRKGVPILDRPAIVEELLGL